VPVPIAGMGFADGLLDKEMLLRVECCGPSLAMLGTNAKNKQRCSALFRRVCLSQGDRAQYPAVSVHA
jgi:hypothetical protein